MRYRSESRSGNFDIFYQAKFYISHSTYSTEVPDKIMSF